MKEEAATEVFTVKIEDEDKKVVWLRKGGQKVEFTKRKALRNYIRNNLSRTRFAIFRNGQPFKFEDLAPQTSPFTHPIEVHENVIVQGHHRFAVAQKLGIDLSLSGQ